MSGEEAPILEGDINPENITYLNRVACKQRNMFEEGTHTLANGIELRPQHAFGFPNRHLNPYFHFVNSGMKYILKPNKTYPHRYTDLSDWELSGGI